MFYSLLIGVAAVVLFRRRSVLPTDYDDDGNVEGQGDMDKRRSDVDECGGDVDERHRRFLHARPWTWRYRFVSPERALAG